MKRTILVGLLLLGTMVWAQGYADPNDYFLPSIDAGKTTHKDAGN